MEHKARVSSLPGNHDSGAQEEANISRVSPALVGLARSAMKQKKVDLTIHSQLFPSSCRSMTLTRCRVIITRTSYLILGRSPSQLKKASHSATASNNYMYAIYDSSVNQPCYKSKWIAISYSQTGLCRYFVGFE
mmetsp:Transcript_9609/g.21346  ORF Transcript_9609/g.21346 Transcript_9609/m.21346 type:complete len:134 (-) Transcript_9609:1384-1785(-)